MNRQSRPSLLCAAGASAILLFASSLAFAGTAPPDEALRSRGQTGLHADPYFDDAHATVSVANGDVYLGGFVFSDSELRSALRIARDSAGDVSVVDNLSIRVGERR